MEKQLIGMKERFTAIADFAKEGLELIAALEEESGEEKTPATPKKPAGKKAETPALAAKKDAKKPALGKKAAKEEPEPEEEDGEESDVEAVIEKYELAEKSVKELKDMLNEAEVKYNKNAKSVAALAPVVAQAIIDGDIEMEDAGEDGEEDGEEAGEEITDEQIQEVIEEYGLDEMKVKELRTLCDENEIVYSNRADAETLRIVIARAVINGEIATEGDDGDADSDADSNASSDGGDSEEEAELELSEDVIETMEKVEEKIRKSFKAKKLTIAKIKSFLKEYYQGDKDCKDCKGCTEDEMLDCYIEIQKSLVDDDGDVMEMGSPYNRGGKDFCCGKELQEVDDGQFCVICGETWTEE